MPCCPQKSCKNKSTHKLGYCHLHSKGLPKLSKYCRHTSCTKRARYGLSYPLTHCAVHAAPGMSNLTGNFIDQEGQKTKIKSNYNKWI